MLSMVSLIVSACGATGAMPAGEPAPDGVAATAGLVAYTSTWPACHEANGQGVPGLGKPLVGSVLVDETSDPELVEFLKVGRSTGDPLNTSGVDMPRRGGNPSLDDDHLRDLVTYIRSLS